jgi:integrase
MSGARSLCGCTCCRCSAKTALAQLSPTDLQKLCAAKIASGLSARTVHHIHATIHRALAQAERWGKVTRNVASLVDAPRVPEHEMTTLDEEQLRALLTSARDSTQEAVMVLAATTGMRLSEVLGLRWRAVDLEGGEVKLRATLERREDGPHFVETKTKGSRRGIVLVDVTIDALRRHRVR